MNRMLKAIGLTLVSTLALGVLGASAAQAEEEFTATEYPVEIQGQNVKDYEFVVGTNKVVCKVAKITTQEIGQFKGMTEKLKFSECKVGTAPATFTENACDFVGYKDQTKKISCVPGGKKYELHIYPNAMKHGANEAMCEYTIGEQELSGVEYKNISGSPEDITSTDEISGIEYTVTGSKLLCGESAANGTLSGGMTFTGTNESEEAIGLMVE